MGPCLASNLKLLKILNGKVSKILSGSDLIRAVLYYN